MSTAALLELADGQAGTDEEVVARVLGGETALFEIIMRRYNQRLYRVARSILRNDEEAEDVAQDAYVRAYQHLSQFAGRAKFSTWLTRIAVHEALSRLSRRTRFEAIDALAEFQADKMKELQSTAPNPEQQASTVEAGSLLEQTILALPEGYRAVLMMRDIEGMNTAETAECLDITEENVKVRLHRARALMRRELYSRVGATSSAAFQFMGARCDRLVKTVFERIALLDHQPVSEA
jgi:RNA polymerase sigma-70 factor (ECF subfamily)